MKRIVYIVLLIATGAIPLYSQVVVIANKSVPVNSIDATKLSDIFLVNSKTWSDGSTIVVFWLRDQAGVEQTFTDFLGLKPLEMRKVWMRVQLSGDGKAPLTLTSEEDVLQRVASTRGAIGFIASSKVTRAVKVLATIE